MSVLRVGHETFETEAKPTMDGASRPLDHANGTSLAAREVLPRDVVLRHLAGEPVSRLPLMPITMQFAARLAGVLYGDYCRDYRVLVQAQEFVAERFEFDYVSCISDPAREASDLGAQVVWFDDQPPAIDESDAVLADRSDFAKMRLIDPSQGERMSDRVKAAEMLSQGAGRSRLVEGWVEGPCAEAADLRGINALMLDFYDAPAFVEELFEFTIEQGIAFARAQVDAGVDIVGIGDAAASLVGPRIYSEFVWPHEKKLIDAVHEMGALVRLHICGNTSQSAEAIGRLGADLVDIDSPVPVDLARSAMGPDQVLLGNLNPVSEIMNSTADAVLEQLRQRHDQAGSRYIVGAGCEIPVTTPHENVHALGAYARSTAP